MKVSVVIPNWNGEELLAKNLPAVLGIGADEVIVVDDASNDSSVRFLKTTFPKVKLVKHTRNLGFAKSVNDGFQEAKGDVVVLLNTDVVPKKGLLRSVLPHFEDKDVFAVSFNEGKWGFARGVFYRGLIEHRPGEKVKETRDTFWASGGSAAFNRKKWEELRGLDSLYTPFYWEDIDLSYRAQMRGWKVLWEPQARVVHEHEATIGRFFGERKKNWIAERNQLLFFWKNVKSQKFWLLHFLWLPIRLARLGRWVPFLWAILKLPQVVKRRLETKGRVVSDEEILAKWRDY